SARNLQMPAACFATCAIRFSLRPTAPFRSPTASCSTRGGPTRAPSSRRGAPCHASSQPRGTRPPMTLIAATTGAAEPPARSSRTVVAGTMLAALVVAGDLLLWQQRPGLGLFACFMLLIGGVLALHRRRRWTPVLAAVAVIAALPLVEAPSLWALL